MSPFEILDEMLEKIHEYPHKARHYNKILLRSIKTYKRKYKNAIKENFKDAALPRNKKRKYEIKSTEALDLKIEASKTMLELTSSILDELKSLIKDNDAGICLDAPSVHNTPNVVKVGAPSKGAYCECKQPAYGDMICCDSLKCKIGWFHFKCVWLSAVPKGNWYCPSCKKDWRLCRLE